MLTKSCCPFKSRFAVLKSPFFLRNQNNPFFKGLKIFVNFKSSDLRVSISASLNEIKTLFLYWERISLISASNVSFCSTFLTSLEIFLENALTLVVIEEVFPGTNDPAGKFQIDPFSLGMLINGLTSNTNDQGRILQMWAGEGCQRFSED